MLKVSLNSEFAIAPQGTTGYSSSKSVVDRKGLQSTEAFETSPPRKMWTQLVILAVFNGLHYPIECHLWTPHIVDDSDRSCSGHNTGGPPPP